MKASEIVAAAWLMHRGQPKEQEYDVGKDHLCNIITWHFAYCDYKELQLAKECIKANLPNEYTVADFREVFIQQYPLFESEDWEVYKHMPVYLEAKAKWVADIVAQLQQQEQTECLSSN